MKPPTSQGEPVTPKCECRCHELGTPRGGLKLKCDGCKCIYEGDNKPLHSPQSGKSDGTDLSTMTRWKCPNCGMVTLDGDKFGCSVPFLHTKQTLDSGKEWEEQFDKLFHDWNNQKAIKIYISSLLQESREAQLTSLEGAIKEKSEIDEDEYMFVDDQDKKLAAGAYIGYTDAIKSVLDLIKSRREGSL